MPNRRLLQIYWGLGSNGTENGAKAFSFVDSSEFPGVIRLVATPREELRQRVQLEQQLIVRLRTATLRFSNAQTERIWAIVSAHQAGLSIRKIAGATGLSSSRIHPSTNCSTRPKPRRSPPG